MTRRRHLGLAVAGAAIAVLVGQSALAGTRALEDASELRAFQRSKLPTDVRRGRFADRLQLFGVGFGLGRSAPAFAGAFLGADAVGPGTVANAVTLRYQVQRRALGLATAATTLIALGWAGVS